MSQVNPAFEKAANDLIAARKNYLSVSSSVGKSEGEQTDSPEDKALKDAEKKFHAAENIFCNLPGIIEGGKDSSDVASQKVKAIMEEVSIFYS